MKEKIINKIKKNIWSFILIFFTIITCISVIISRLNWKLKKSIGHIIINNSLQINLSEKYVSNFYCIILIITTFTIFFFAIDAIIKENEFQLLVFLLSTFFISFRITYQVLLIKIIKGKIIFHSK
jgi:hypothetical protein